MSLNVRDDAALREGHRASLRVPSPVSRRLACTGRRAKVLLWLELFEKCWGSQSVGWIWEPKVPNAHPGTPIRLYPTREEERMIRRYGKILLLAICVLLTAACPKYRTTQNDDVKSHSFDRYRGGD